ncbi:MAG: Omp28 family outer membrane lipoprotein [Prevotellaceae bacterium]|nr:Omp28 family outer membrane lipoprotein [Candidatus Minthosoma caballi]
MMKNTTYYLGLALMALGLTLSACDSVDENERYIAAEIPEVGRNVLVEEYTGQFCVNCPDGHATLKKIKELYGDKVITVGIHAGALSWDDVEHGGLKTPEGDAYADKWGVEAYPSIIVDHKGTPISTMAQWQDAVQKNMGQVAKADIELSASLSEDGKKIEIKSSLLANNSMSASYQIWITESKIAAFQQTLSDNVLDYEHNHVYRASVNGVGGEEISLSSGIIAEKTHTIEINNSWEKQNLSVVAFLYDGNGVIQVEEAAVDSFEK